MICLISSGTHTHTPLCRLLFVTFTTTHLLLHTYMPHTPTIHTCSHHLPPHPPLPCHSLLQVFYHNTTTTTHTHTITTTTCMYTHYHTHTRACTTVGNIWCFGRQTDRLTDSSRQTSSSSRNPHRTQTGKQDCLCSCFLMLLCLPELPMPMLLCLPYHSLLLHFSFFFFSCPVIHLSQSSNPQSGREAGGGRKGEGNGRGKAGEEEECLLTCCRQLSVWNTS